jgi:hypothetical protein
MTTDQRPFAEHPAHSAIKASRSTGTRITKGIALAGLLTGAMLTSWGQAAASPLTTTDTHGGFNSRILLSGDDYRSSTQSMPLKTTLGTWANQAKLRQPIIFAHPQRTAG